MWKLDCEEGWPPKNWCFWTVVLEKTLESPLDCKEIQTVHSEGDQPLDFFGRNDAKAETPVLWSLHAKCWLIGKNSDAGKDWGQEEKRAAEDEMAGWHHWLDGRIWVNSGNWWWTGRPGMLWFMESQRVRHKWATELNWNISHIYRTFLMAQTVNYLPTMWETQLWSLGWEDPLEKEMATHSSTFAWKIPWTDEPGRLQSMSWTWLTD